MLSVLALLCFDVSVRTSQPRPPGENADIAPTNTLILRWENISVYSALLSAFIQRSCPKDKGGRLLAAIFLDPDTVGKW